MNSNSISGTKNTLTIYEVILLIYWFQVQGETFDVKKDKAKIEQKSFNAFHPFT